MVFFHFRWVRLDASINLSHCSSSSWLIRSLNGSKSSLPFHTKKWHKVVKLELLESHWIQPMHTNQNSTHQIITHSYKRMGQHYANSYSTVVSDVLVSRKKNCLRLPLQQQYSPISQNRKSVATLTKIVSVPFQQAKFNTFMPMFIRNGCHLSESLYCSGTTSSAIVRRPFTFVSKAITQCNNKMYISVMRGKREFPI